MDKEAHSDGDGNYEYETVRDNERLICQRWLSFIINLRRKWFHGTQTESIILFYVKLCDRFEQLKTAHINCLDLCPDSHIIKTLAMDFDSCKKKNSRSSGKDYQSG